MQIVISDVNILMDSNQAGAIFCLPYRITVADILYERELKDCCSHLLQAGLHVRSLVPEFVQKTEELILKYPRPSILEHTSLALAIQEACPLLTQDKALKEAAAAERVEVHDTLWLVQTLLQQKLIKEGRIPCNQT